MNNYFNTVATSGTTWTISGSGGSAPEKTPAGLIVTRAVETKNGWLGHVIVDKAIVHETRVHTSSAGAIDDANHLVVDTIKALFSPSAIKRRVKDAASEQDG